MSPIDHDKLTGCHDCGTLLNYVGYVEVYVATGSEFYCRSCHYVRHPEDIPNPAFDVGLQRPPIGRAL